MIREESFIKAWENRRLVGGAIKAAGEGEIIKTMLICFKMVF